MTDPVDTATAIHREIERLRGLGHEVEAVIVSHETQEALEGAQLGYWRVGPGFFSIFNVKVVLAPVEVGWAVKVRTE